MYNKEIEDKLNELLQATFQMNSFADNCAYWLAYNSFIETEKEFHEKFAHVFPKWADKISTLMIQLNLKPIRIGLVDNIKQYQNHEEMFAEIDQSMLDYRQKVCNTIEIAEMNDIKEVVIVLEEYLLIILPYVKQTDIWRTRAFQISDIPKFDKYFEDFTII